MKKPVCHIDFETRSVVDLPKAGAYIYSRHKTTDALCLAYAMNDEAIDLWIFGQPMPRNLAEYVKCRDVVFAAHNATFEFLIWNYVCAAKYGWPQMPMARLDCTMIRSYAMGLPGKLELAAKAVGMPYEKDMKGHRIMMQLCKPRKAYSDGTVIWWHPKDSTPTLNIGAKYDALYRYCKTDIVVERELDKRVLPLSTSERKLWLLDQKINSRGVCLDLVAARKAIGIVKKEQVKFNDAVSEITDGEVSTCNASIAMRKWINAQGIDCDGVAKADVLDLLEEKLPDKVRNVLLLKQNGSRSSTAKLNRMITSRGEGNRVRGCFQYYGAASTGRWAGRLIQLQNLKRPDITQSEIELIMQKLDEAPPQEARDYLNIFHGSAIKPIADCMRAMLVAPRGKKLISSDFIAVEGRMLAWLAGQEDTLNVYRSHGQIYEHRACQIYGLNNINLVTKEQRLVGKVAELALGYQGGVGAFQSMAKVYFIKVPDEQAEAIKKLWRQGNPNVVSYWFNLERAAIAAVQNPGQKFACGPKGRHVIFLKKGSFLFCRLPSGRPIVYPYPRMKLVRTPWGEFKNALHYKGIVYGKFVSRVAYGGLIAENITQATARDLLAEALFRFEARKFPVVMHVHDEIVTEIDKNFGTPTECADLMSELPTWATELPIQCAAWEGERYRK